MWISIYKDLPWDIGQEVLAYVTDPNHTILPSTEVLHYFDGKFWRNYGSEAMRYPVVVSHWQYLPFTPEFEASLLKKELQSADNKTDIERALILKKLAMVGIISNEVIDEIKTDLLCRVKAKQDMQKHLQSAFVGEFFNNTESIKAFNKSLKDNFQKHASECNVVDCSDFSCGSSYPDEEL